MPNKYDQNKVRISLRLTKLDKKIIDEKVKKSRLNFTQYATQVLLHSHIKPKYSDAYAQLIHHDTKQLTSHINALTTVINKHFRKEKSYITPRYIGAKAKDDKQQLLEEILRNQAELRDEIRKLVSKIDGQKTK